MTPTTPLTRPRRRTGRTADDAGHLQGHRPGHAAADRARQVAAAVVLLGVLAAIPAALVVLVGWPLPDAVPTGGELRAFLTRPLSSMAVVQVLATVTWVVWVHFVTCMAVEVLNATARRGRPAVDIPLGGANQVVARRLVAAVLLIGATGPLLTGPGHGAHAIPGSLSAAPPLPPIHQVHQVDEVLEPADLGLHPGSGRFTGTSAVDVFASTHASAPTPSAPAAAAATAQDARAVEQAGVEELRRYVVAPPQVGQYDNLWDIAAQHLGDGMRWSQVYALNVGAAQPDGGALADPDLVRPGWQLRMPADATHLPAWSTAASAQVDATSAGPPGADAATTGARDPQSTVAHVVQPGDTLWGIAQDRLGDGTRYTDLAASAGGLVQPDGARLADPDLIRPGWVIPILDPVPGDTGAPAGPAPAEPALPAPAPAPVEPATVELAPVEPAPAQPSGALQGPVSGAALEQLMGERTPLASDSTSGVPPAPTVRAPLEATGPVDGQVDGDRDAAAAQDRADAQGDVDGDGDVDVVAATAAGALLLGGVLAALLTARRRQFRFRRPGRAIAPTPPELVAVEQALLVAGPAGQSQSQFLDLALRALAAATASTAAGMPDIIAAGMGPQRLDLRLRRPRLDPPAPFTADDSGLWWSVPTTAALDPALRDTQLAPLPTLVTIGGRGPARWMIDLEAAGLVTVHGPRRRTRALVRFMAAELATNAWSDMVTVTVAGVGDELAPLNPDRVRVEENPGAAIAHHQEYQAQRQDLLTRTGMDALAGRVQDVAGDSWMPRVLVLDRPTADDPTADDPTAGDPTADDSIADELESPTMRAAGRRLGTAAVVVGAAAPAASSDVHPDPAAAAAAAAPPVDSAAEQAADDAAGGLMIVIDEAGQLSIDELDLSADAEGLTAAEAHGMAMVVATARDCGDTATPRAGDAPRSPFAASTGALLPALTTPRPTSSTAAVGLVQDGGSAAGSEPGAGEELAGSELGADDNTEPAPGSATGPDDAAAGCGSSLLPLDDDVYLRAAATTAADLAALAPRVPDRVRSMVEDADPGLDGDLADWHAGDCDRPRLSLLGTPSLRAHGEAPRAVAACVELAAFMALRPRERIDRLDGTSTVQPRGVTTDQVGAALGVQQTSARTQLSKLRGWLGTNPRTGDRHLPDAVRGHASGAGLYVVADLLVDVDLMLRLYTRGCARGGAAGLADLRAALALVTGEPFTQLRRGGWTWVTRGERVDHHATAAIVDMAHLVVVDALAAGDTRTARTAAQTAQMAAPHEETPRLDLVAVREAEGDRAAAELDLRRTVLDRVDDDRDVPGDPPQRTAQIIERRGWLRRTG